MSVYIVCLLSYQFLDQVLFSKLLAAGLRPHHCPFKAQAQAHGNSISKEARQSIGKPIVVELGKETKRT